MVTSRNTRVSLSTVQAGRGIAALLVVLFHLSGSFFVLKEYWGFDPTHKTFAFGHAGVHFFFVLSGFIIFLAHGKDLGQRSCVQRYAQKRFVRIYPIYWFLLAFIVPVYFLIPSFGQGYERDLSVLISSITLLHLNSDDTILVVAWTLYHEVLFYFVFGLAIWHRTTGILVMALWFLGSAASLAVSDRLYPLAFFFSPMHLLFAMGMGSAWLIHRNRVKMPWLLSVAGVLLFFGLGAAENSNREWYSVDVRSLLYGLGSAMAVTGLVTLEQQGKVRVWAPLRVLGDASYAIYLIQFPVLSILVRVFMLSGARTHLPPLLSFVLLAVATVAIGVAFHFIIERPLLKWFNAHLKLRSATEKPSPVPVGIN